MFKKLLITKSVKKEIKQLLETIEKDKYELNTIIEKMENLSLSTKNDLKESAGEFLAAKDKGLHYDEKYINDLKEFVNNIKSEHEILKKRADELTNRLKENQNKIVQLKKEYDL